MELEWENGSPLDTPRDELTVVTEQQIQALLDEIRERFATPAARAVEAAKDREKPASEPRTASADGVEEAREALKALPNDYSRDGWVRIGMAAYEAGLSFEDFDAWSKPHPTYDPKHTRATWRSFKKGVREITRATLFGEVCQRVPGWKPSRRRSCVLEKAATRNDRLTLVDGGGGKPDGGPVPPSADEAWNAFARPQVTSFPLDALPETMRAYVEERATASGADINAFAMASLATLSGVIDHRLKLKPKKYHDDLYISPNLWTLIVAPPSTRKTAIMRDVYDAIDRLDARDVTAYEVEKAKEAARAETEKCDVKKIPPPRHRILTDTTSERLCDLLSHQDCGAILVKDELSGWFGAMDKYGGGGRGAAQDRSIWLRAFDGGPYTQHRLTTVDRRVKNLSVAIIGSIQPERLREMGRLDTDGLIQRFLPVMMDEARPYRDEPRDVEVERRFTALIDGLDGTPPIPLLLSDRGGLTSLASRTR